MTKSVNESENSEKTVKIADTVEDPSVDQWLQIRKEAGLRIDPETAEVIWDWGDTLDPYDILPVVPVEARVIGRVYFARSPDSDGWVSFYDLPDEVREKLWEMHSSKLAFPAGLLAEIAHAREIVAHGISAEQLRTFEAAIAEGAEPMEALRRVVDRLIGETTRGTSAESD